MSIKTYKRILIALLIIIAIPISIFISTATIGPATNNAKAKSIANKLEQLALPPGFELIESSFFCGNTTGTSNHVEIWAGVLIYSELPEDEVHQFYEKELINHLDFDPLFVPVPEDSSSYYPKMRSFMSFTHLDDISSVKGYYIIGGYFDAVTQCDLRGH